MADTGGHDLYEDLALLRPFQVELHDLQRLFHLKRDSSSCLHFMLQSGYQRRLRRHAKKDKPRSCNSLFQSRDDAMVGWDGIEEAVAVDATGSFAAAAAALGVSTSHVSRAIARLEDIVQAPIFHRTTRRVVVTEDGRALIEQLRRIVQMRDEAFASISPDGEPQGTIRLTCSTALGERFVAPIVRQFAVDHPRISISLDLTNRVIDLVNEGYDLAIRTGQLVDSRLTTTRIASRGLYTCASRAYLRARGTPDTIADLGNHECLVGTSAVWHFVKDGKEASYRPQGRWQCNSGMAVMDAAIAGIGICQLPDFYVRPALEDGRLTTVLDPFKPEDEAIWAVYPQRRHLLPKVRAMVDRLRQELPRSLSASTLRDDRPA
jgi:DNA-binding transcriptional LysR family regulator